MSGTSSTISAVMSDALGTPLVLGAEYITAVQCSGSNVAVHRGVYVKDTPMNRATLRLVSSRFVDAKTAKLTEVDHGQNGGLYSVFPATLFPAP